MLTNFQFFTDKLNSKLLDKSLLNITSLLKHVAALPCEMFLHKRRYPGGTEWRENTTQDSVIQKSFQKYSTTDVGIMWSTDEKMATPKHVMTDCIQLQ